METKKPTQITIQKEKGIVDPFPKETIKNSSNQLQHKAYKVYSPYNCPGYPACRECMNIIC